MSEDLKNLSKTLKMVMQQRTGRARGDDEEGGWAAGVDAIQGVLRYVSQTKPRAPVWAEIARMIYVRTTAIFEGLIRETIRGAIDSVAGARSLPPEMVASLGRQKFTIAEIHDVFARNVTLGELATAGSSLRSPTYVVAYAGKLLGVDFAARMNAAGVHSSVPAGVGESVMRDIGSIERGIEARHRAAHGLALDFEPTVEDARGYFEYAMIFAGVFESVFAEAFRDVVEKGHDSV